VKTRRKSLAIESGAVRGLEGRTYCSPAITGGTRTAVAAADKRKKNRDESNAAASSSMDPLLCRSVCDL